MLVIFPERSYYGASIGPRVAPCLSTRQAINKVISRMYLQWYKQVRTGNVVLGSIYFPIQTNQTIVPLIWDILSHCLDIEK